ncbi:MAG TPA: CoA transferase [Novosphingobium sp.]|nr:CoA transferase [Novosphingobium sp.]
MPADRIDRSAGPAIPLSRWAGREIERLAALTGSPGIAALEGAMLLGERALQRHCNVAATMSVGTGTCRLLATRDHGWFALTLPRQDDRELLPALFGDDGFDIADDGAVERLVRRHDRAELVGRGRALGLPVASADERPVSPAAIPLTRGPFRDRAADRRPLVIDLSAVWAGPLAGHLLWLAGAEVVKVESRSRPDRMRGSDPALFALVNQGKASVAVDLRDPADRRALVDLIRRADIVIESSRPRALQQLGIDADALVREVPGLVWLTITAHGATGEAAGWTGLGNDCGVAGGLTRALAEASGRIGFVGDAIADPLTGIAAALEGWQAYRAGEALRIGLAMSAIAARALAEERAHDAAAIEAELRAWGAAIGQPFPRVPERALMGDVRPFGMDTGAFLSTVAPC